MCNIMYYGTQRLLLTSTGSAVHPCRHCKPVLVLSLGEFKQFLEVDFGSFCSVQKLLRDTKHTRKLTRPGNDDDDLIISCIRCCCFIASIEMLCAGVRHLGVIFGSLMYVDELGGV